MRLVSEWSNKEVYPVDWETTGMHQTANVDAVKSTNFCTKQL